MTDEQIYRLVFWLLICTTLIAPTVWGRAVAWGLAVAVLLGKLA